MGPTGGKMLDTTRFRMLGLLIWVPTNQKAKATALRFPSLPPPRGLGGGVGCQVKDLEGSDPTGSLFNLGKLVSWCTKQLHQEKLLGVHKGLH